MRLEWLDDILAVVDTGSFSEAAERRFLTQSAFSRRIRMIEDHVGVELFDRSRKPVQLNAATAAQEPRLRELTDALRALTNDLRSQNQTAANHIVVVAQHAIASGSAPTVVQDLVEGAGLSVRLRSANLDECYGMLLNHGAEIALTYGTEGDPTPGREGFFDTLVLGRDRLIAVAQTLPQDGALPIVAYPGDVYLGRLFDRAILPRLDRTVDRRAETALTTAALQMALSGIATAWVPASLAASALERGELIHLSELPSVPLSLIAARPADKPSPAENRAWERLKQLRL